MKWIQLLVLLTGLVLTAFGFSVGYDIGKAQGYRQAERQILATDFRR